MDKVPLSRRRRVQVLQPSAPNCSCQIITSPADVDFIIQSSNLFCCQCVIKPFSPIYKQQGDWVQLKGVVSSSLPSFLVLFTRSSPRIWILDEAEPELRVYLGSHRRIRCSVHTRELMCSHSNEKSVRKKYWENCLRGGFSPRVPRS